MARDERAEIVYPDTRSVADDVACDGAKDEISTASNPQGVENIATSRTRKLDARQLSAILSRRDLALVSRHDHRERTDSKSRDDPTNNHAREACGKRLNEPSDREYDGAPKDDSLATEDVGQSATG